MIRDLVVAWIIEPTSRLDILRVPEAAGVAAVSYRTVKRACRSMRDLTLSGSAGH